MRLIPTVRIYDGYTDGVRLYLKGRAFKTRFIKRTTGRSIGGNFLESLLRFVTVEYEAIVIDLVIGSNRYSSVTDEEGYFTFDEIMTEPIVKKRKQWLDVSVSADHLDFSDQSFDGRVLYVPKDADVLIISDIDDTIMWSYVTSYLKVKMMYFTFTRSPFHRSPVNGMNSLIHKILDPSKHGAIFYVSNSPWNIYDFLKRFIDHYKYPDGPTFLRDYGRQLLFRKKNAPTHKVETLHRIIRTFKNQKFVLIGDSAEKDIDYYILMHKIYGDQIKRIIIHDVNHRNNRKRIETLIKNNVTIPIQLTSKISDLIAK